MPAALVVITYLAAAGLAMCIAAGIVGAIGVQRLGRWLRLDVGDER